MTQATISNDLEHKAYKWGAWTGSDMASRQWRKNFPYFTPAEIQINAEVSSSNNAIDYHVSADVYTQFEQLFTEAYTAAYEEKVEELKAKEAARQAQIVRK